MNIREVLVRYRRSELPNRQSLQFQNSRQVFLQFQSAYLEPVEVFKVILLNSKNRMIYYEDISRGSLSTSVVHPREVFWSAVYHRSAAIILIHNHPSGDPAPSREDRECTNRIFQAGKMLGIKVLDHIIIGENDYFSFADAGLLLDQNP